MPKVGYRKFAFSLRARVAVPNQAGVVGLITARTQDVTAENSYRVEFDLHGTAVTGAFGESGLLAANPPTVQDHTALAAFDGGSVLAFARACIKPAPGGAVAAREVYLAYVHYAAARDYLPVTEKRFAMILKATNEFHADRTSTIRRYLNIELTEDKPQQPAARKRSVKRRR